MTPPPLRAAPEFDLSEGPHLSYAIQWFSFALMLGWGVYYVAHRPGAGERFIRPSLAFVKCGFSLERYCRHPPGLRV